MGEVVKLVEIHKKMLFFEKYKKLNPLFSEIEKRSKGIAIVFGSYANFSSNKKSDFDLLVIGTVSDLEDLENLYNIKINVVKSTGEKFKSDTLFFNEIMKNHVVLKGVEEFVGLIW